jgi:hypothetical protein
MGWGHQSIVGFQIERQTYRKTWFLLWRFPPQTNPGNQLGSEMCFYSISWVFEILRGGHVFFVVFFWVSYLTNSLSLSLSLSPVLKIIQQPQTRWKWCKSCKPGDWGQKLSFLCYGFIIPPVSIPGFTLLVERKTERKTASVVLTQWISELLLNHELNHWIS